MIYINDKELSITRFPDKTSQVWKLSEDVLNSKFCQILWEFDNEGEFLTIAQLKMLLDSYDINTTLKLDYLPYGRQDKHISNYATFALHTFARLLNSLNFETVSILDPHSEVALNVIKNSIAEYPSMVDVLGVVVPDILCYPDKGARIKYTKVYGNNFFPFVYGEKVRCQFTGKILDYQLIGDVQDKNVLIVDDICDGGNTFIILAQHLLLSGASEVNLFVTHGIFSNGLKVLKNSGIKRIFTKNGEACSHKESIFYRKVK